MDSLLTPPYVCSREKEREEVEARRALPEALRMKEDTERAKKSREEKQKGNQVFMQKYHHKGAFYGVRSHSPPSLCPRSS